MKPPSIRLSCAALVIFLFIYAPIAVVIIYSFNAARFGAGWSGFTTQWYAALWQNPIALSAAKNTVLLALSSTAISTVLGTMLGFALQRFQFRGKGWLSGFLYIPVFLPDIVLAAALLLFYSVVRSWLGIFELGLTTMVIAHVTFQIPFVAIVVKSRLAGFDRTIEEAAQDLGANSWQTFRLITLPLILPGILAAAALAFTLSLDDFVVSFFTSGPGSTTLPILIYSSVKRGVTPDINALSTLIIFASILGAVAVSLFGKQSNGSR
ncbi:MAG: ABC transporter permease [Limisphaerales bacterium]